MPKSIKPSMSKDMLSVFDKDITSIEYDSGELKVTVSLYTGDGDVFPVFFDEKNLETMLEFLRRFKNENK